ncbi:MAG: SIR2 family protein [Actinomycetota bacterium]|nr:SIR2 family protein [Actinomycetota bacterium]
MTERIVRLLAEDWRAEEKKVSQAMNFVCGQMIAHATSFGASPFESLDVEDLFSAVQLLASRREHEAAPLVAAWHPGVEAFDGKSMPSNFDRSFANFLLGKSDRPSEIVRQAIEAMTGPGDGRVYRRLIERMTTALRQLVHIDDEGSLEYLMPILDLAQRDHRLTVATLNYDRSIELISRAKGVHVETGMEQWSEKGSWQWAEHGVRLLKLHGSIDWCEEHFGRSHEGALRQSRIRITDDPLNETSRPAVVFGQRGKLRAEGPILDLLAKFRDDLNETDELVVMGYSFRDEHINEYIRRWINADSLRRIIVVDPEFPQRSGSLERGFRAEMVRALLPVSSHQKFAPRLGVVREAASSALPKVTADDWWESNLTTDDPDGTSEAVRG